MGINAKQSLTGTLTSRVKLAGEVHVTSIVDRNKEAYEGEYILNPTFEEQVLPTKNKQMSDDLTIHAIKVERVANESGGKTVIIGV